MALHLRTATTGRGHTWGRRGHIAHTFDGECHSHRAIRGHRCSCLVGATRLEQVSHKARGPGWHRRVFAALAWLARLRSGFLQRLQSLPVLIVAIFRVLHGRRLSAQAAGVLPLPPACPSGILCKFGCFSWQPLHLGCLTFTAPACPFDQPAPEAWHLLPSFPPVQAAALADFVKNIAACTQRR